MAEFADAEWWRSTQCGNANCIEVAFLEDTVAVRDSKDPHGPVLRFSAAEWTAFLAGVRNGELGFDLS